MGWRNINQNWNNQIGGNLWGFGGDSNQGITSASIEPGLRKYFSDSNQMVYPGSAYSPHRGFEEMQTDGIMATNQAQDKGNILKRILDSTVMGKIMGGFKRPEQMDEAYQAITGSADDEGYGKYKGNEYRIDDNKIYSELYPQGKNFDSLAGSKSIEEMENEGYGSIGWAQERLQKGKNISTRLRNILKSRGIGEGGNFINRPTNEGAQFGTPVAIPSAPIQPNIPHDRGGSTPTPQSWNRDQGGGYTTARGFTKADTGGRGFHGGFADGGRIGFFEGGSFKDFLESNIGHLDESIQDDIWSAYSSGDQDALMKLLQIHIGFENRAQGGRAGYAFAGPVGVEQQTDFIEGPQGGEEFQETVVEGQEQPSREQLEALAMEIFQLPLEELDEQQLIVVYKEAMQGQPMEEAVQEEDVQFAANGGLAGLL